MVGAEPKDRCRTWSLGADKTTLVLVCLVLVATDVQTHTEQEIACSVMRTTAKTHKLEMNPRLGILLKPGSPVTLM